MKQPVAVLSFRATAPYYKRPTTPIRPFGISALEEKIQLGNYHSRDAPLQTSAQSPVTRCFYGAGDHGTHYGFHRLPAIGEWWRCRGRLPTLSRLLAAGAAAEGPHCAVSSGGASGGAADAG